MHSELALLVIGYPVRSGFRDQCPLNLHISKYNQIIFAQNRIARVRRHSHEWQMVFTTHNNIKLK